MEMQDTGAGIHGADSIRDDLGLGQGDEWIVRASRDHPRQRRIDDQEAHCLPVEWQEMRVGGDRALIGAFAFPS
jgi:hypothetical protein